MRKVFTEMMQWLRKHYRMACCVFLGVVLVSWTAFMDASDRKWIKANSHLEVTDLSSTPTVRPDSSGEKATAEPSKEPTFAPTQEPTPELTQTPEPTVEITPEPTSEPTPEPTPEPTAEPTPEPTPVLTQAVDNTPSFTLTFKYAIADVENKLNIRSAPGTESTVIAYLKPMGYCEVLEWGTEWTKIKSGTVTGYVYTEYLRFNEDAVSKLHANNKLFIKVTSSVVNIRSQANTECEVLGKGASGSKYVYLPYSSVEGWYCIRFSETQKAFITDQYSEILIDTSVAVPLS